LIRGLALSVLLALALQPLRAQNIGASGRVVEQHDFSDAEGKLLGYYSAVVVFSPTGSRVEARPWSVDLGVELSYVPRLSPDQRSAGRTKLESTNLVPVFPRPRLALWLPGGLQLEGSSTPPIKVFAVKAQLYALALSAPVTSVEGVELALRVSFVGGRVSGAITCYHELAQGDVSRTEYWFHICHARESDDRFEPSQWAGELIGTLPKHYGAVVPYAGIGAQRERTKFDVGVLTTDGARDLDHPILELRAIREYGVAGLTWRVARRAHVSSELFYAPGSVLTVRALASLDIHGR